jgi:hypothetical protein
VPGFFLTGGWLFPAPDGPTSAGMNARPTKITFAEMREMGVRGSSSFIARIIVAATRQP